MVLKSSTLPSSINSTLLYVFCINISELYNTTFKNDSSCLYKSASIDNHYRNYGADAKVRRGDDLRVAYVITPLVSISELSSLYLASVAVQASVCLTWLCPTWSQTSKTGFLVTRLNLCHHTLT